MFLLDSLSILGKIVLIILGVLSFHPQLQRLQSRGESIGISLFYVLFNTVVATEQFTAGIFLIAFELGGSWMVHSPPLFGEWLNLVQFGAIWLSHLVLFLYCLYLPPTRLAEKLIVIIGYLAFFVISLGALIFLSIEFATSGRDDGNWLPIILGAPHLLYINPVITVVVIFSLVAQATQMSRNISRSALSTNGLLAQTILFAIIGVSWVFRLVSPEEFYRPGNPWRNWNMWLELVGWAVLDNLVFAFVQGALFCIAWRRRDDTATVDETTSLLAQG